MRIQRWLSVILLVVVALLAPSHGVSQGNGPPPQPAEFVYKEMLTVYYGNLARRDHGMPPLRWNGPMTEAARWFDWDSVENRPPDYCGHQDTLGRWPSERVPPFGYKGFCGAENCYCGYMEPQAAINGWMDSPGHRANLLDPNSREIGMGYYVRTSDWRGYLTQNFGQDPVFPPVVIDNEAPQTTDTAVALYVYDRAGGGGFAGLGPATHMQVANDPCFDGAGWEPYRAEKSWALEPGSGWRTVYVKTRDALGRTTTVSDTIYLGHDLPMDELGLHLAVANTDRVTLYSLNTGWPYVQLSQNWFADDTFDTFTLWWGNGERISDSSALGGTAFRLRPGDGESFAWVWTTEFFKETPFVAYFRLKVNDNALTDQVARISVEVGGVEYGLLTLTGTDFAAPDAYQEFAIPFTFHDNPDDGFLTFNFWRSGQADVYVDGVSIFTASQPVTSPLTWQVPGGNYRGGGVWLRYVDAVGNVSSRTDATLMASRLAVTPASLAFLAQAGDLAAAQTLAVAQAGCGALSWSVSDDAAWLHTTVAGDAVHVWADTAGLAIGTYTAWVTVEAEPGVLDSPAHIPVTLRVAQQLYPAYLPLVLQAAGTGR